MNNKIRLCIELAQSPVSVDRDHWTNENMSYYTLVYWDLFLAILNKR